MKKLKSLILLCAICLINSIVCGDNVAKDSAITAAVKSKLLLEKDIPSTNITVTTNDSVVFLEGMVDTQLQLNRIVELVFSMDSVKEVDISKLTVKDSESILVDGIITSKVMGRIKYLADSNKISKNYSLSVETKDGIVHIFGNVEKRGDIDTIVKEAKTIAAVKSVQNNIKVGK